MDVSPLYLRCPETSKKYQPISDITSSGSEIRAHKIISVYSGTV